jgi:hypothetical protein
LDSRTVNVARLVPLSPSAKLTSATVTRGGADTTISDQLLSVPPKTPSTSRVQFPSVLCPSTADSGVSGRNVPVYGDAPLLMVPAASSEKTVLRYSGPRSVPVTATSETRVPDGERRTALTNPTSGALRLNRTSRSAMPRSSVTFSVERVTAKKASGIGVSVELNTYWSPMANDAVKRSSAASPSTPSASWSIRLPTRSAIDGPSTSW